MADPVRISRQGLTTCPSCKTHIKIADSLAQTSCPFCESALIGPAGSGSQSRFGTKGRSLLAASLLGAAMVFTACPGAEPPKEKGAEQTADAAPAPAYGIPAPDESKAEQLPDTPVYGKPPDDAKSEQAPDSTGGPLYGLPADR